MNKHMGRNPFDKKSAKSPSISNGGFSKPAEWLLIDLPARSFMFGLRTVLMLKNALNKGKKTA